MLCFALLGMHRQGCNVGVDGECQTCQSRLRAERAAMTYTSFTGPLYAPYSPSGSTQQLVWPYIVSGRSVAAIRNTSPWPCRSMRHGCETGTVQQHPAAGVAVHDIRLQLCRHEEHVALPLCRRRRMWCAALQRVLRSVQWEYVMAFDGVLRTQSEQDTREQLACRAESQQLHCIQPCTAHAELRAGSCSAFTRGPEGYVACKSTNMAMG